MAPSTDLWPGLRRRIEAERRFESRSMPRWGLAMAAGLVAAGVLIGFKTEDDWFEYRLQNDPRFLRRIELARQSIQTGKGVPLEEVSD